ncbi:uncharacterized protein JCM6883_006720 [Sporobolomyces salmoneus]|uniref:uncharacterized protein n=1 Tax=Sporobolomyces salmoneus TaxID=183962 RepID=UPI00317B57BB
MTRYIIFTGAPTIAECRAPLLNPSEPRSSHWRTTTFEFSSSEQGNDSTSPSTSKDRKTVEEVWDVTGSQFKDAVETPVRRGEEKERQRKRRRTTNASTQVAMEEESQCQSFFMFPPPSQPRVSRPSTQSQRPATRSRASEIVPPSPRQERMRSNDTTRFSQFPDPSNTVLEGDETTFTRHYNLTSIMEASSSPPHHETSSPSRSPTKNSEATDSFLDSSSLELSIGPPPNLPWSLHDLTKLDQLSRLHPVHSSSKHNGDSLIVSVLAMISSVTLKEVLNQNTGMGMKLNEMVLEDETGGIVRLVAWGQQGEELNQVLRVGDLVYFGKVKLLKSNYNQSLELRLIEGTSRIGISFRTRVFEEHEDALYRFERVWIKELEQARTVYEIVDWWTTNRE